MGGEAKMNLPNLLTIFRLVLVPVYVAVFCAEPQAHVASALIFWLAGATDVLDGYLARRLNLTTRVGQVLDPLADKCMQLAVIITLFFDKLLPVWFIGLLVAKELIMIVGGVFLYIRKTYVKSNVFGKLNTVFLFLVMSLVLFIPSMNGTVKNILLGISALLALLAGATYLYLYFVQNQQFKTYVHSKGKEEIK